MIDFAEAPPTEEAVTSTGSTPGFDPSQIEEHRQDEEIIGRNRRSFEDVGGALFRIRERRSYRLTHPTFDDYCRERWELSRTRAYQLIDSYMVIRNVKNFRQNLPILPANEAQTYCLARLPPELQGEIWLRVVETSPNGKITAAHVESIAHDYRGQGNESDESPVDWPLIKHIAYLNARLRVIAGRWPGDHIDVMAHHLHGLADELLKRGKLRG